MDKWHLIDSPPPKPVQVEFYFGKAPMEDQNGVAVVLPHYRDCRRELGYWDGEVFHELNTGHRINEFGDTPTEFLPTHWRALPPAPNASALPDRGNAAGSTRRLKCAQGRLMAEGRMIGTDRVGHIEVGDGAIMSVPIGEWLWQLRYARPEPDRGTMCDDRMLAAGVLESYMYLVQECTKEEAWRRIKIMREALRNANQQQARESKDG